MPFEKMERSGVNESTMSPRAVTCRMRRIKLSVAHRGGKHGRSTFPPIARWAFAPAPDFGAEFAIHAQRGRECRPCGV